MALGDIPGIGMVMIDGIVRCGRNTPPATEIPAVLWTVGTARVRASTLNDEHSVLEPLAQDRIHPSIHAVLPRSMVRAAQQLVETGMTRLVLDPWA